MVDRSLAVLPIVLKDTSKVYEQISIRLRDSKINLDYIKENRLIEREKLRKVNAEKLRCKRHLCCLDALTQNLHKEINELDEKIQELVHKIGNVTWNQNKADLIGTSELKTYERKEALIENFIAENDVQRVIPSKHYTNYGKEKEEKLRTMNEEKKILETELKDIMSKIAEATSEIFNIEQENKVLQKRNSALLLRLQKLQKETENRRNQVAASLERMKQENIKM